MPRGFSYSSHRERESQDKLRNFYGSFEKYSDNRREDYGNGPRRDSSSYNQNRERYGSQQYRESYNNSSRQYSNQNERYESRQTQTNGVDVKYIQALAMFGLEDTPTKEEFHKIYRKMIAKYHPDNGGTEEQCAIFNKSKDYIEKYNGWI